MDTAAAKVAVVGGGPAGLMAAELLAQAGVQVDLFDAMPSVGRKFLLAGRGGLNLTHSEATSALLARYGQRAGDLRESVQAFDGTAVREWAAGLGIETFVGTSGRVFPKDLKAAPLLRAWLHRLRAAGVRMHARHRWTGWTADGRLRFESPAGELEHSADATVLALGGASWSRLGSDGAWLPWLQQRGVEIAPLRPSNCGFDVAGGWSEHLRTRFAGQPLKTVAAAVAASGAGVPGVTPAYEDWSEHLRTRFAGQPLKTVAAAVAASGAGVPGVTPAYEDQPNPGTEEDRQPPGRLAVSAQPNPGTEEDRHPPGRLAVSAQPNPGTEEFQRGEFVITDTGVEGSLVYALSAQLREQIAAHGEATLLVDLLPQHSPEQVLAETRRPRGPRSLSTHLKSRLGIQGLKMALLHERLSPAQLADPAQLAQALKALPIPLARPRPLDEAISTAGGVRFEALGADGSLRALPGTFCAGEMLDWEAPTGGYLLTACFATGRRAAQDALRWLSARPAAHEG